MNPIKQIDYVSHIDGKDNLLVCQRVKENLKFGVRNAEAHLDKFGPSSGYVQKFKLYETCSNFYIIGRDKEQNLLESVKD